MPPTSTALYEEGAEIRSLKIVSRGIYSGDELRRLLVDEPAKYPGCSGCRNFRDVESDLKAQIAANHKGAVLLRGLVKESDLKTVHSYMEYIRGYVEADFDLTADAQQCRACGTEYAQSCRGQSGDQHSLCKSER